MPSPAAGLVGTLRSKRLASAYRRASAPAAEKNRLLQDDLGHIQGASTRKACRLLTVGPSILGIAIGSRRGPVQGSSAVSRCCPERFCHGLVVGPAKPGANAMRRIAAVTTCNREGYELYGRRLLESFDRHWPASVTLHLYAEGFAPDVTSPRIVAHDLLGAAPDLVEFRRRHAANPDAHGRLRRRLRVVSNWSTLKVRVRRVTE